jgi:hypothetical protein
VVAGDTNSAAITRCGQVFMWGSCRSCIDLASNDPTKPTLVEALSGTPIAAVALGECHCLFLTTDGLVLSCGLDLYVQPAHTLRGRARGVPLGHLGHHSANQGGGWVGLSHRYHSGLLGYDVRDNPRKEQRVPRPIPHFTGEVAAAIAAGTPQAPKEKSQSCDVCELTRSATSAPGQQARDIAWCSPETAASSPLGTIAAVNWAWGAHRPS